MKVENSRDREVDLVEDVEVEDTHENPLTSYFSCVCQTRQAIVIT